MKKEKEEKQQETIFLQFAGEQDAELLAVVLREAAEESKEWNNTAGTPLCVKVKGDRIVVCYKEEIG